jgi:hypothetical protein
VISSAENIATTPPSLLGIDRRMAYSHRKYHSGLMWVGVTKGLARRKFSGSVNKLGLYIISIINNIRTIAYTNLSLIEKYEWNGIRFEFASMPIGLFEPVWWRNRRCIITMALITNGRMK